MTADEYLSEVLASQALGDDSDELNALQTHRADVEKLIRDNFKNTALTIRYAGSKAKGTMNKESYDLDIVSYVASGDNTAGETLENIYENHKKALGKKYIVEPKGSALRLKGCDPVNLGVDFHIDVVPGRFTDDTKTDAYLYQSGGDKTRLKTNLDVHLDHVRNSGVIDAIRMAKLWRVRNGLPIRTFVLELAVIKLLEGQEEEEPVCADGALLDRTARQFRQSVCRRPRQSQRQRPVQMPRRQSEESARVRREAHARAD